MSAAATFLNLVDGILYLGMEVGHYIYPEVKGFEYNHQTLANKI